MFVLFTIFTLNDFLTNSANQIHKKTKWYKYKVVYKKNIFFAQRKTKNVCSSLYFHLALQVWNIFKYYGHALLHTRTHISLFSPFITANSPTCFFYIIRSTFFLFIRRFRSANVTFLACNYYSSKFFVNNIFSFLSFQGDGSHC